MFQDIKKVKLIEKIRVMAATGQSGEEIKKSLSKEELGLMKSLSNDIEKGKPAQVGEVRDWQGKRMRKQANGKWLEISERGMTKKEHEEELARNNKEKERRLTNKYKVGPTVENQIRLHDTLSSKLSEKEYDESELSSSID